MVLEHYQFFSFSFSFPNTTTNNPMSPILPNTTIHNMNDSHSTLISINVATQTPLKLTSTNYVSQKLQFQTLFVGYDLLGYLDRSKRYPTTTLTQNGVTISNSTYTIWIQQDQLLMNVIIGSLSLATILSLQK